MTPPAEQPNQPEWICWYSYQGMETEGRLDLEEPYIVRAQDAHEALWKWSFYRKSRGERTLIGWDSIYGSLEEYRLREPEPCGWGVWARKLA